MEEEDKVEIARKKYHATPKGKASKAKQNRRYAKKVKRITIFFIGDNQEIYDYIQNHKQGATLNQIALAALREWILRNL
jgi:hypothetical protein